MVELLKAALRSRGIHETIDYAELEPQRWHGDLHYKVSINKQLYSARLIHGNREFNCIPPIIMNERIINAQLEFGDLLALKNIPFMNVVRSEIDNSCFSSIWWNEEKFYFLLFKWINGRMISASNEEISFKLGKILSKMHQVGECYSKDYLLKLNGKGDYLERIEAIRRVVDKRYIEKSIIQKIESYIQIAVKNIDNAFDYDLKELIPVHGDLNFQNIIWDNDKDEINGIIDFDSIGLADRINDLAWVLKWYSRIEGIQNEVFSFELAKKTFEGYGGFEAFNDDELRRLPSSIWINSCLNNNFLKKFIDSLEKGTTLKVLEKYLIRGEKLVNICRRIIDGD